MGIEPITDRLQGGCSAIELRRQKNNFLLNSKPTKNIIPNHTYKDKVRMLDFISHFIPEIEVKLSQW